MEIDFEQVLWQKLGICRENSHSELGPLRKCGLDLIKEIRGKAYRDRDDGLGNEDKEWLKKMRKEGKEKQDKTNNLKNKSD